MSLNVLALNLHRVEMLLENRFSQMLISAIDDVSIASHLRLELARYEELLIRI